MEGREGKKEEGKEENLSFHFIRSTEFLGSWSTVASLCTMIHIRLILVRPLNIMQWSDGLNVG
jgi:hypothetical protein